jgi:putative endonuclease
MAQTAIQSIGERAEQIALEHLLQHKLRYLQRNFHCRSGEIDLVMLDDGCLVFVEVRFRTRSSFTTAALSIGAAKQRKIIRTASYFIGGRRRYANATVRFDVVGIDGAKSGQYTIQWIKDAFRP